MFYRMKQGESPTQVARRFGLPLQTLISANPHKPTMLVAGVRTWDKVSRGERVHVPLSGSVGADAASDIVAALVSAGGPCLRANVALVCAAQRALGVVVDGKWGSNTAAAAKARGIPNAPGGCSPTPSWWVKGVSACPPVSAAPVPAPAPTPAPQMPAATIPTVIPPEFQALLTINPCLASAAPVICMVQKVLGVTVDGKYGNDTATALRRRVPNAPPGCSPRPSWWAPAGKSNCVAAAPVPSAPAPAPIPATPSVAPPPVAPPSAAPSVTPAAVIPQPAPVAAAPAAVQALLSIDPCSPSSAAAVCAAQRALGVTVDGKYGNDTASAARRVLPGAPPACSPRPSWWAPVGQTNCGGALPPVPQVTPAPPPPPPPGPPPIQPVPGSQSVVAPEKKEISTGAIVAGAVGAAALVGIVAIAATSGKKGSRGARGKRGSRGPSKKSKKRKSSKRKR